MGSSPRHRLFVEDGLAAGGEVALRHDQAHRLLHVLRASRGDEVALFNGRDGEWRAELVQVGKRGATLAIREQLSAQIDEQDLWLCFAPIKRGPLDMMMEKATELGVSVLQPVWTKFTDPQRLNQDRMRAIAVEASEQCGRHTIPLTPEARTLDALLANWPKDRRLIHLDETGNGAPIASVLTALPPGPAAFLVGPVGGFAESELDALRALSFAVAADLGPRILRAETAAIAALACYQALCPGRRGARIHQPR